MCDATLNDTIDQPRQDLLKRHADWWQRRGTLFAHVDSQPLGDLWLPLADGTLAHEDLDITPEMLDVERLVGPTQEPGPIRLEGDLFRTVAPYGRVPWVEAILGTPIRATIQGGSMRTHAFIHNWDEWDRRESHRDDGWLDLLKQLTELHVKRASGRYGVVHTLMRGPSDLAEAVLGPELMCYSMYDHPQRLQRFLEMVTQTFIEILEAQSTRIPSLQGGNINPFGIWAPGTVVRTQCDASVILSPKHYAEWYLPYDVKISEAVDFSVIHLHSCSLHTVDALLEVERPHAIQVTLEDEPSGPPLEEIMPIFEKILRVKPVILDGPLTDDQAQQVLDQLPPDGLCLIARQSGW